MLRLSMMALVVTCLLPSPAFDPEYQSQDLAVSLRTREPERQWATTTYVRDALLMKSMVDERQKPCLRSH